MASEHIKFNNEVLNTFAISSLVQFWRNIPDISNSITTTLKIFTKNL